MSIALTGASGKIGGAVLSALLEYSLVPASSLVISTSSDPASAQWNAFKAQGGTVRHGSYDDEASLESSFAGCEKLFLVSTPRIEMDYDEAPHGSGREKHHFAAINAAVKAGVKHIYYTSLGFGDESKSGVMIAHNRTEAFLKNDLSKDVGYTIIREGLYNESWPLYLGYYDLKNDDRDEIVVAGDGKISWAAIRDLGLGTALILVDKSGKYTGSTLILSATTSCTLQEIAEIVSQAKGKKLGLKVVSRKQHEKHYIEDRGQDSRNVRWWSKTYDAVKAGECDNKDDLLERLLATKGRKLIPLRETIEGMLKGT